VGRHVVPLLAAAGHEVVGATRTPKKVDAIRALGAEPVVVDVLNLDAVMTAVTQAKPEVVVHQLTAISGSATLRKFDAYFAATNQLRIAGSDHLLAAATAGGARRFVAQSYTGWPNERTGGLVKTEQDPIDPHPAAAPRQTVAALRHLESAVSSAHPMEGIVLHYGAFYGPGTDIGAGGQVLQMIRKRQLPVDGGAGI
jgi:nucleoside-diphosphate-sugar epimerase